jgi:hypothetical protein
MPSGYTVRGGEVRNLKSETAGQADPPPKAAEGTNGDTRDKLADMASPPVCARDRVMLVCRERGSQSRTGPTQQD